jgi:hypothetical protein
MAQATPMIAVLAAAEQQLTPLSPIAKALGTVLAVAIVGASAYLLFKQRRYSDLTAGLRWRSPIAVLVGLLGFVVLAGVWIDPTKAPIAFVGVWLAILGLAFSLLLIAGLDMLQVRQRAMQQRLDLLRESRRLLGEDLRTRRNGAPPHSHNGSNGVHS